MNSTYYYEMPLEELCARTIAHARWFASDLPAADIARDALEYGAIKRDLERLEADAGIVTDAEAGLCALHGILDRELEKETQGWSNEFDGYEHPELGSIGQVRQVRSLTERGKTIENHIDQLHTLLDMRGVCRARLDAERIVMRRMSV